MNKKRVNILILVLLAAVLVVTSAMAKNRNGDPVTIQVRNRTGAPISIIFSDTQGLYRYFFNLPVNETLVTIPHQGWYTYQAQTSCGAVSGQINIDVFKAFNFHCKGAVVPTVGWFRYKDGLIPQ